MQLAGSALPTEFQRVLAIADLGTTTTVCSVPVMLDLPEGRVELAAIDGECWYLPQEVLLESQACFVPHFHKRDAPFRRHIHRTKIPSAMLMWKLSVVSGMLDTGSITPFNRLNASSHEMHLNYGCAGGKYVKMLSAGFFGQ